MGFLKKTWKPKSGINIRTINKKSIVGGGDVEIKTDVSELELTDTEVKNLFLSGYKKVTIK